MDIQQNSTTGNKKIALSAILQRNGNTDYSPTRAGFARAMFLTDLSRCGRRPWVGLKRRVTGLDSRKRGCRPRRRPPCARRAEQMNGDPVEAWWSPGGAAYWGEGVGNRRPIAVHEEGRAAARIWLQTRRGQSRLGRRPSLRKRYCALPYFDRISLSDIRI